MARRAVGVLIEVVLSSAMVGVAPPSYDPGVTDRRNASPTTSTAAGVLRPEELARHVQVERLACAEALDPWVENYWLLRWDLPEGTSHLSSTLPHPACTLSVERGHRRPEVGDDPVVVTGVLTRRFDVDVRDRAGCSA